MRCGNSKVTDCREIRVVLFRKRVLTPMATYSHGYEENLKRAIRDAVAIDPVAGIYQLTETLSKRLDHSFDARYIKRLRDKVIRQNLIELDRAQIEGRIAITRENYRIVRGELMKIMLWTPDTAVPGVPKPLAKDRVEAAKSIVMLDLALLNVEIANGMYKKPIDAIVKEYRYGPLPDEVRAVIIASWTRGGLLPKKAIEQMVPRVEATECPTT
jgi:hypothetical protein